MALIKLRKASEVGEDAGIVFINSDQILAITDGRNTTEIQMADGRTRWVKETVEEVALMFKGSA